MFKFLKKKDPIEEFWQWFEMNRAFYEGLEDDKLGENLDSLYQRVLAISPGLAVEISRREAEGVRELVISANGNVDLFPLVGEFVVKAPNFDRWTVTAFRPRIPEASVLRSDDGLEFDIGKICFIAFEDGGELDIAIFVKNIGGRDERQVFSLGMVVIDNLLGEYDSATKVRGFAFYDLDDAPEDLPVRPLIELPNTVDDLHRRSNN